METQKDIKKMAEDYVKSLRFEKVQEVRAAAQCGRPSFCHWFSSGVRR